MYTYAVQISEYFAGRDFIIEAEDVLCAWQNEYNEKAKYADFICRCLRTAGTANGSGAMKYRGTVLQYDCNKKGF